MHHNGRATRYRAAVGEASSVATAPAVCEVCNGVAPRDRTRCLAHSPYARRVAGQAKRMRSRKANAK